MKEAPKTTREKYKLRILEVLLEHPGLGFNELRDELNDRYRIQCKDTLKYALDELYEDGVIDIDKGRRGKHLHYITEAYLKKHEDEIKVMKMIKELEYELSLFEGRYSSGITLENWKYWKERWKDFLKDDLKIGGMLTEIRDSLMMGVIKGLFRGELKNQLWEQFTELEKEYHDFMNEINTRIRKFAEKMNKMLGLGIEWIIDSDDPRTFLRMRDEMMCKEIYKPIKEDEVINHLIKKLKNENPEITEEEIEEKIKRISNSLKRWIDEENRKKYEEYEKCKKMIDEWDEVF